MKHNVPAEIMMHECAYVRGATGFWSRLWRSMRAAWRCARLASKENRKCGTY
jgi:hypothetical protein